MSANVPADRNFAPLPPPPEGLRWLDALDSSHFRLEGAPWFGQTRNLRRLSPEAWAHPEVSDSLRHVAEQPAGIALRFLTDAEAIGFDVQLSRAEHSRSVTVCALSGFDLYRDGAFAVNVSPNDPSATAFSTFAQIPIELRTQSPGLREWLIYFPLQNPVQSLKLGFSTQAHVAPAPAKPKTLLFYGSSITQGFCASRPGLTYPARVCRALDSALINLGYGGNAHGEQAVAQAIAQVPMDAFIYDYDHNAYNPEELAQRHLAFLETVLTTRPDLPVLVMSAPDFHKDAGFFDRRVSIIEQTVRTLRNRGKRNIALVRGESFWTPQDECTVDRLHPNDAGFERMAQAVCSQLSALLTR